MTEISCVLEPKKMTPIKIMAPPINCPRMLKKKERGESEHEREAATMKGREGERARESENVWITFIFRKRAI
jgi:hypothetical protein